MALVKCKECGNKVSTKADKCPNCGAAIKKSIGCVGCMGWLGILVLGLIFLGVIGNFLEPDPTKEKAGRPSSPQTKVATKKEPQTKTVYDMSLIVPLTEQEKEKPVVTPSPTKQETQKPTVASMPTVEREKVVTPRYSVLNEEVHDVPIKTQVVLNILVSGEISEAGLKALLNQLYSSIKVRRGFKYHDCPTNIYIYVFTSKERAESGMGQWVAMLQKSYDDIKPTISINERQIVQLRAKPEERFDLSEEKRKEIWEELLLSEDRARKEAEQQYPLDPTQSLRVGQVFELSKETPLMPELEPADPMAAMQRVLRLPPRTSIKILGVGMKQQTLWYSVEATSPSKSSSAGGWINSITLMGQGPVDTNQQLEKQVELEKHAREKHEKDIAKKYGLTLEQLHEIYLEGIVKDWAFPKAASKSTLIIERSVSRAVSSYDDDTKEYKKLQNHTDDQVPSRVLKQIKQRVASRHPDSYGIQKMLIRAEIEAYKELQRYSENRVPSRVLEQIKRTVASRHPDSYSVQKTLIDSEVQAYKELQSYRESHIPSRVLEQIKGRLARRHPDSYSVQKTLIDAEVEAYKELQSYSDNRIPSRVLDRIKRNVARRHPGSYSVQKTLIDAEVESYVERARW